MSAHIHIHTHTLAQTTSTRAHSELAELLAVFIIIAGGGIGWKSRRISWGLSLGFWHGRRLGPVHDCLGGLLRSLILLGCRRSGHWRGFRFDIKFAVVPALASTISVVPPEGYLWLSALKRAQARSGFNFIEKFREVVWLPLGPSCEFHVPRGVVRPLPCGIDRGARTSST
jgi:hypothetical protein